jgi:hypothetical protein
MNSHPITGQPRFADELLSTVAPLTRQRRSARRWRAAIARMLRRLADWLEPGSVAQARPLLPR